MPELKISSPVQIALPTRVVELPDPSDDGPIIVRIRYLHYSALTALLGGIATRTQAPAPKTVEGATRMVEAGEAVARRVAEEILIEPRFTFDAREEGAAFWGDLTSGNQLAITAAAMAFAQEGSKKSADAALVAAQPAAQEAAAEAVTSFPVQSGG